MIPRVRVELKTYKFYNPRMSGNEERTKDPQLSQQRRKPAIEKKKKLVISWVEEKLNEIEH
jgi:hypothetical protein